MSLLGMRTIEFPGWGNIFNHTDAIHFKKLLESLKPYLKAKLEPKSGVRIDPSNLGLNVPMPERLPISVIHLLASKTPGHLDHRLEGIGLFIEVKTNIIHENRLNKLKKINNYFDTEIGQISVRTPEQNTANSKGFILLREYAIDLNRILDTEDFQTAKERMIKFAEESLNHLKKTISQNERL